MYHLFGLTISFHSSIQGHAHPTEEAEKGRIIIKDVDADVMKELLKFMYTAQIHPEFLKKHCEALWRAADKYDVEGVLLLCQRQLLKNVTNENAVVMYDLAGNPESLLAKKSIEIISK